MGGLWRRGWRHSGPPVHSRHSGATRASTHPSVPVGAFCVLKQCAVVHARYLVRDLPGGCVMARMFGTDGVRGLANADLTPEFAMEVAASAAGVVAAHDRSHRPTAVVGRDPRRSGQMLEAAVVAGLASAGADVVRVGL